MPLFFAEAAAAGYYPMHFAQRLARSEFACVFSKIHLAARPSATHRQFTPSLERLSLSFFRGCTLAAMGSDEPEVNVSYQTVFYLELYTTTSGASHHRRGEAAAAATTTAMGAGPFSFFPFRTTDGRTEDGGNGTKPTAIAMRANIIQRPRGIRCRTVLKTAERAGGELLYCYTSNNRSRPAASVWRQLGSLSSPLLARQTASRLAAGRSAGRPAATPESRLVRPSVQRTLSSCCWQCVCLF